MARWFRGLDSRFSGSDSIIACVRFVALVEAIPRSLATAVGISAASHLAFYGLAPVLSLHLVALGGTSTQVGLLFSTFSLVAVVLRPAAGAWIDRQGLRRALLPGAALMVLSSLGLQAATRPLVFIGVMAGFGAGFGLATMAAAVQAASAPADRRGSALGIYYLTSPVSMAVAAPLELGGNGIASAVISSITSIATMRPYPNTRRSVSRFVENMEMAHSSGR